MNNSLNELYNNMDDIPSINKSWKKACVGCAFKCSNPQKLHENVLKDLIQAVRTGLIDFYCMHRKDKTGKVRRCASSAAIQHGRGLR